MDDRGLRYGKNVRAGLKCSRYVAVVLLLLGFPGNINCLRVWDVKVPGYSVKGERIALECNYDLGYDQLYSVKWYKGYKEFFRYVPGDNPPVQIFMVNGVLIDTTRSTARRVILRNVTRDSSGKYKCEVSAEAPSFRTDSGTGELLVVDLPKNLPKISGVWPKYHIRDVLDVNCTSARSKPAAALSWYINKKKADKNYLVDYAPQTDKGGLESSTLGLKFEVKPFHLHNGELQLRCTATIASVYFKESSTNSLKVRLIPRESSFRRHNRLTGSANVILQNKRNVITALLLVCLSKQR